jgi:alanine-glyoxylate transaminase/serine-glyoxylate transaminase/serine-pyruvate transaminase
MRSPLSPPAVDFSVSMRSGRLFLQIPGPTNVPERVLRAMDRAVIDHRGADFAQVVREVLPLLQGVFRTEQGKVVLYPASGTGAWEAALVNTLAPGDRALAFNVGYFSQQFAQAARNLGFAVDDAALPWDRPVPPALVEERLRADQRRAIKAVLVVHNETSTGVTSDIAAIRAAMDAARHPALLIVDTVSSLGSLAFRFDEWRVDVALTGSQKGLMLPPGMAILCVGPRALAASASGGSPRNFFDWRPILKENEAGFFPYTPATLLLFGLREALHLLTEEGLENVLERHRRLADGVRAAVRAWGLALWCADERAYSNSLTAVRVPEGIDSTQVCRKAQSRYNLALGVGLGQLRGKVFRIGHLGALGELEVLATIAGIELVLAELGTRIELGSGVAAAQRAFAGVAAEAMA